jgi:hypothetical protein
VFEIKVVVQSASGKVADGGDPNGIIGFQINKWLKTFNH